MRQTFYVAAKGKNVWLVGGGYLSAESISLVLTVPDDHTDKEIKEVVTKLLAA